MKSYKMRIKNRAFLQALFFIAYKLEETYEII